MQTIAIIIRLCKFPYIVIINITVIFILDRIENRTVIILKDNPIFAVLLFKESHIHFILIHFIYIPTILIAPISEDIIIHHRRFLGRFSRTRIFGIITGQVFLYFKNTIFIHKGHGIYFSRITIRRLSRIVSDINHMTRHI